ncbi:hypothetical protein [Corynebacterium glyciniphilum]
MSLVVARRRSSSLVVARRRSSSLVTDTNHLFAGATVDSGSPRSGLDL